ncbi:MAG: cytochrome c oxidase assembly protein [Acidimicrobiales bacterium]
MHVPAFSLHLPAWTGVLCCAAGYAALIRRPRFVVTKRQAWSFLGAMGVLLVALTWPLANLAAHELLVALVLQRLLLMLAVPPLLFSGVPVSLAAAATRPSLLDTAARVCSRPVPAALVVTAVAVGTLTVPAVDLQASSEFARGVFDVLLLAAGCVLWLPVRHPVPGTGSMSSLGAAGYLVVQSILPSFLSIVWIFARHPLYPAYAHVGRVLSLTPLADQEVSGFVAKLGTIFVLWSVAFALVVRSERVAEEGGDPDPLTWADVERELERAARRERHGARVAGARGRGRDPDDLGDSGEPPSRGE